MGLESRKETEWETEAWSRVSLCQPHHSLPSPQRSPCRGPDSKPLPSALTHCVNLAIWLPLSGSLYVPLLASGKWKEWATAAVITLDVALVRVTLSTVCIFILKNITGSRLSLQCHPSYFAFLWEFGRLVTAGAQGVAHTHEPSCLYHSCHLGLLRGVCLADDCHT